MDTPRNLVLVGFMGTGKSSIGRLVAQMAHALFWEMDSEIALRAKKSIPRIFAEDGEAAFRDAESALAQEWGQKKGAVISCGGGVVLRPENVRALSANGLLVCLTARPEVICERTARAKNRPLLATSNPLEKISTLLDARAQAYAAIPIQVDTSKRTPQEVATQLLALWKQSP